MHLADVAGKQKNLRIADTPPPIRTSLPLYCRPLYFCPYLCPELWARLFRLPQPCCAAVHACVVSFEIRANGYRRRLVEQGAHFWILRESRGQQAGALSRLRAANSNPGVKAHTAVHRRASSPETAHLPSQNHHNLRVCIITDRFLIPRRESLMKGKATVAS
jgi:hypothetical protein